MTVPRVSITLCCYNSEQYVDETLQSIFAQRYKDWELVVVNDGSRDRTEEIIEKYIDQGWPIVYHNQQNAGLVAARNKSIELARGEFVALIDHDDLWTADKLEKQIPLFTNPRVAVVYSGTVVVGSDGQMLREFMPRERMYRGRVLDGLFLGTFLACSSVVIRRSALMDVGLFRPGLTISEEYELFLRLAEKYDFDYAEEPLTKWRLHASNTTWDFRRCREEQAMLLRELLAKHPDIRERFGERVVTLRLAGFSCTVEQARLLGGWGRLLGEMQRSLFGDRSHEIFSTAAKYLIASLPVGLIDTFQRVLAWSRRRAALS